MSIKTLRSIALVAVALAASPCFAETDGQVTFGSHWYGQTVNEAKFQEFRDLPRGAFLEAFRMSERQGPWALTLSGRNATLEDGAYDLMAAKGIRWRVDLAYQEIPHLFSQIARTPYSEVSPGLFRLPDSLQRTNQEFPTRYVATMTDLLSTADLVALSTRTDVSRARLRARPGPGVRFEVRAVERKRTGHQAQSATFGFSATTELPVPISQRTTDVDGIASYERGSVRVQAIGGVSQFRNDVPTLIWDNSQRVTDDVTNPTTAQRGPKAGRLSFAPDNDVVRGSFSLGLRLPRASMFAATVGVSEGRQDANFIPYTINSLLPQSLLDSLPARSLDGRVRTITQDYRLTGQPMERVRGVLRFHDDNTTNDTPEHEFTGFSPTDVSFSTNLEENPLLEFGRSTLGADVTLELTDWANVSLLGEHRRRTRVDREVEGDKETVFGGRIWLEPADALTLSGGFQHGDRKEDGFSTTFLTASGEQTRLRRFDVANRKQDLGHAALEYTIGWGIETSVDYSYTRSKFDDSHFGLQRAEEHLAVGDATVKPHKNVELSGGYGIDQVDTRQASQQSASGTNPAIDWWANLRDRTVFVYSRDSWWAIPKRLQLTGDYTFTRALGQYHLSNNPALPPAVDLPNTYSRRHELMLESRWSLQPDFDVAVRAGYEQFHVEDFATQNVPLLGGTSSAATAIYLGDSIQSYVAHRYAVVVYRRF